MLKRLTLALAAITLVCTTGAHSKDAATLVRSEVDQVKKLAAAQSPEEEMWKQVAPAVDRFVTMADTALAAGNLLYAVEAIGKANEYVGAFESAKRAQQDKADRAAFDSEWKSASLLLTSHEKNSQQRNWSATPAALRALAESSQGQGEPLLEGGRAFASLNDIVGGFFYVGQAKGQEHSAKFAASVPLNREGTALPLRSILPELHKLQQRTNVAFAPPRSIDKHPQFIRLNGTLKTAFELDSGKLYAGALYQYLQAVSYFETLDAPDLDEAKRFQVRGAIKAARQKLAKSTRDDSLAEMFIQRTETLIAKKNGVDATAEEWKNAAAVVDHVIPAYYDYLASHPAKSDYQKPAVTVTLVRWPYT
jgi:hypothetical protein